MTILSIVMTIYNGEKVIQKCLNSILTQQFENYEVICVDDGSTDNSWVILQQIAQRDGRVKIIRQCNKGVWFARETGINAARGKWIGFVDCDDTIDPQMYSTLVSIGESEPEIDMVVCGFNKVDVETEQVYATQMTCFGNCVMDCREDDAFLTVVNPSMCNKIFLLERCREAISISNAPRIMEDLVFAASVYPQYRKVAFSDTAFYQYYDQRGSVTKNIGMADIRNAEEALLLVREFYNMKYPDRKELLDVLVFLHLGVGMLVNYNEVGRKPSLREIHRGLIDYLDCNFEKWKRNSYLNLGTVRIIPQNLKFCLVYKIYKTPLFIMAVKLYHFATRRFRIELKW